MADSTKDPVLFRQKMTRISRRVSAARGMLDKVEAMLDGALEVIEVEPVTGIGHAEMDVRGCLDAVRSALVHSVNAKHICDGLRGQARRGGTRS